tara:strand:+ start:396 stop:515 length:120 start_codon:yes stop_codon:yes gene_type:complete
MGFSPFIKAIAFHPALTEIWIENGSLNTTPGLRKAQPPV